MPQIDLTACAGQCDVKLLADPTDKLDHGRAMRRQRLVKLAHQLTRLRMEGLALYQPLGIAKQFHACTNKWRIVEGGNRCLSGDQEIYDPVLKESRKVRDIDGAFYVYTRNPDTGERAIAKASRPFVKGRGEMFRVKLTNSETIEVTENHHVLTHEGRWTSIGDATVRRTLLLSTDTLPGRCSYSAKPDALGDTLPEHPNVFAVSELDGICAIVNSQSLGEQDIWDFTVEGYANYYAGGLVHANSGKTTTGAVEMVRAVTGSDPYDKAVKRDGRALCVGLDNDQLALMWKKCASPGAFKIVKDEHTKLFRAVRPDPNDPLHLDPYDLAYQEKWQDAPPLLPPRFIKSVAWEEHGRGVPRKVVLTTGWEIWWRSSKGDPSQGEHLNWGWIDEHIKNEGFFKQMRRGLTGLAEIKKHSPKMVWSATPEDFNPQLSDLREAAKNNDPEVGAFIMVVTNNPFIPDSEKKALYDRMSEDDRQVLWYGKPALEQQRVYPSYEPQGVHGYEPFPIDLSKWTRYVILDPGRQHCGTVFAAVDPEHKHVWIYDAFDLRNGDAIEWAGMVADRQYDMQFEAFIIDQQMGKQHRPGAGLNTAQQYFAALQEAGVKPRTEGPLNGFFPGSNDVSAREESVRGMLAIRGTGPFQGTPLLQVARGMSPVVDKQFRNAYYDKGKRSKVPDQDVLVCVEYMAAFYPTYHPPVPIDDESEEDEYDVYYAYKEIEKKRRRKRYRVSATH